MIITHKITMDLECRGAMPQIEAVQDDRYTRDVAITLTAGGAEWTPPVGAGIVVRYQKPDGNGGKYDTLPDGSVACAVSGNVVTVSLVPQMLTVVGAVPVTVGFVYGDQQISTFGFLINVRPNVGAQIAESEPYLDVRYFLPQPEQAVQGQYLQVERINERGVVTQVKAISGPATPVKGVDYFTEAELTAVVEDAAGLVTPGMIGAAPAGYGLGEDSGSCPNNDCNLAVLNGWYTVSGSHSNGPGYAGCLRVERRDSDVIYQTLYIQNDPPLVAQRACISGTWTAWEWVNPPMVPGVEYRTTERYNGKPVYTKKLDIGTLPNSGELYVDIGVKGQHIITMDAIAVDNNVFRPFPLCSNGSMTPTGYINRVNTGGYLYIITNADWSAFSCTVILKYYKA